MPLEARLPECINKLNKKYDVQCRVRRKTHEMKQRIKSIARISMSFIINSDGFGVVEMSGVMVDTELK